jgi:hypothetical protein
MVRHDAPYELRNHNYVTARKDETPKG